jgi:hypothetical protein
MSLAEADLPSDPAALRAFALACQAELLAANSELKAAQTAVQLTSLEIENVNSHPTATPFSRPIATPPVHGIWAYPCSA